MRKILVLLLAVSLLAISFSGCNNSEEPSINENSSNTTGEQSQPTEPNPASDFEYEINSTQTGVLINKYIGASEHVVIPSHIDNLPVLSLKGVADVQRPSAIAEGAFEKQNIQTVAIPKTVKVVGYKCFKDCQSLISVSIAQDSSLTNINGSAFENCAQIEEIDIGLTHVKEIGSLAFRGCTNLKSVVFSTTLETIKEKAFYECSSLLEVDFPESLTDIEGGAFAFCASLKKIEIPTKLNLTSLSEAIFHDVPNIETVIFKEGRESITGYALIQTSANIQIVVPSSVKRFSPLPFLFNPPAKTTIKFLGNAPTIVEDKDVSWVNDVIIRHNPETAGWESFAWKDKCEIQPSSQT